MPTVKELQKRDKYENRISSLSEILRASKDNAIRTEIDLARELGKYKVWLTDNKMEGNKFK